MIVPAFDGREVIVPCLSALYRQTALPLEVLVVDDASTDGTDEIVSTSFPDVRLVRNETNLGFVRSCNRAIGLARGDLVALLNQDASVHPRWCEAIERTFRVERRIGIVGGIGRDSDGRVRHVGGRIDDRGCAHHLCELPEDPADAATPAPRDVDFVTGASLAVSRAVIETVGLLDEGFAPAYYEDVDWCFRARRAGFRVVVSPEVEFVHLEESRLADSSVGFWSHFQRNRLRFVLRNFPDRRLATFLAAEEALIRDQGPAECVWGVAEEVYFDLGILEGFRRRLEGGPSYG